MVEETRWGKSWRRPAGRDKLGGPRSCRTCGDTASWPGASLLPIHMDTDTDMDTNIRTDSDIKMNTDMRLAMSRQYWRSFRTAGKK